MSRFLLLGLLFGFILSRVGATDFDAIAGMFLLQNLHLVGVIGGAVVVAGLGLEVLRRRGIACESGCDIVIEKKARKPGNVVGSLLFGAGWALTGTCPGTALAQLGEGKLMALFTIAGILGGAALYRRYGVAIEQGLARKPPAELAPSGDAE